VPGQALQKTGGQALYAIMIAIMGKNLPWISGVGMMPGEFDAVLRGRV